MASPGYVVRGKGLPESLHSASHGAGRIMSRTKAMQSFTWSATKKLLAERGLIAADELDAGRMLHPAPPLDRVLRAADVPALLARGASTERPAAAPPRFAVGERVRTRASRFDHHTRLPGYARGKIGRVEHVRGVHVFADTHAHGRGEQPQWLYTVVFSGRELWGDDCAPGLGVSIDAWEPYLEMAP